MTKKLLAAMAELNEKPHGELIDAIDQTTGQALMRLAERYLDEKQEHWLGQVNELPDPRQHRQHRFAYCRLKDGIYHAGQTLVGLREVGALIPELNRVS